MGKPSRPQPPAAAGSTHQEHAHSHHGRGARGHGAVHEDHVVVADVLGQPQVVELGEAGASEDRDPGPA